MPGRGPFKAWAFRIAHNLLVDQRRRSGRRSREEIGESLEDPGISARRVSRRRKEHGR